MDVTKIVKSISNNALFKGLSDNEITSLLNNNEYSVKEYQKNTVISQENESYGHLGFVLDGCVNITKLNHDGQLVIIKPLSKGDFFGEALVFSSGQICPNTIITVSKSTLLFISSASLFALCDKNDVFLKNFLQSLSDKIFHLNNKIKILSYQSVRQRLCFFLLHESQVQKTVTIDIKVRQEDLAQQLGIARPSLSRELKRMVGDNLISMDKKRITLLDISHMKSYL